METFSTRQLAIIASANKTVYWNFRVTDNIGNVFFWSTGNVSSSGNETILHNIVQAPGVYDDAEWDRPHSFRIINFSGITLRRSKSESGIHAPNDLSFTVINTENSLVPDDFIGGSVRICLVIDDGNGRELCGSWRFRITSASPYNQQIDVSCEDFLQQYLKGTYPNTPLVDELYPSIYGTAQDTLCVPEPYGTCYIPLRSFYASSDRYYMLGSSDYTYTIYEVRSPRECGTKITWTSAGYTFAQSTYSGWRLFQPLIASVLAGMTNGVFMSGSKILDVPTKFSRSDTASVTNPADIIRIVLRNMGVQDYDLNLASFDAAKATFASWGLAWNFAFWFREDRTKVLSNLLAMCHSCFVVGEQISLKVLSKTSQGTITDSEVIKNNEVGLDSFKYSGTLLGTSSDSGYVAYQIAGESQDEFLSALVPAKTTTLVKDSETVLFTAVQDTQQIQKLGTLYYQRKFLKSADLSLDAKGLCLAYRPDDVVTISHDDYGGTYDVLIDELTIAPDVTIQFKCQKFSFDLDDWADLSPGAVTVGNTLPVNPYSIVIAGPDGTSSSGTPPNVLPGRLKVGDGTSYIIIDPAPPIKVGVYSASSEKLRIGNLNGFIGVVSDTYGLGVGSASPGFRAKITATEAYIGSDTHYLQYSGSTLTIRGSLNADDITAGTLAAARIDGTYVYAGALTAAQVNAVAIDASSIITGTLAAARMDAAYVYAGTINADNITAGTLSVDRIYANSINGDKIGIGTLTGGDGGNILNATITTYNLAARTIVAGDIKAGEITAYEMHADYIYAGAIDAGQITTGELDVFGQFRTNTGSLLVSLGSYLTSLGTQYPTVGQFTKDGQFHAYYWATSAWVECASIGISTLGSDATAIYGKSDVVNGVGVYGKGNNGSGGVGGVGVWGTGWVGVGALGYGGYGVQATCDTDGGIAVFGSSAAGYGAVGQGYIAGVRGTCTYGPGVDAWSTGDYGINSYGVGGGIYAYTYATSKFGVYGVSLAGYGVTGYGLVGVRADGYGSGGYGVYSTSPYVGIFGQGDVAALLLANAGSAPTHSAPSGSFWVDSGGSLYFRNGTGWQLVVA